MYSKLAVLKSKKLCVYCWCYDCNRKVEDNILKIVRQRMLDCFLYHYYDHEKEKYCQKVMDDYKTAEANWFAKCKQFYLFVIGFVIYSTYNTAFISLQLFCLVY